MATAHVYNIAEELIHCIGVSLDENFTYRFIETTGTECDITGLCAKCGTSPELNIFTDTFKIFKNINICDTLQLHRMLCDCS